jgi:hypothetical protein
MSGNFATLLPLVCVMATAAGAQLMGVSRPETDSNM